MRALHYICLILAIIGAVNWGLVGLFDFNLVSFLFGAESTLSEIVYALVGLAGLVLIGTTAAMASDHEHRHHAHGRHVAT